MNYDPKRIRKASVGNSLAQGLDDEATETNGEWSGEASGVAKFTAQTWEGDYCAASHSVEVTVHFDPATKEWTITKKAYEGRF